MAVTTLVCIFLAGFGFRGLGYQQLLSELSCHICQQKLTSVSELIELTELSAQTSSQ
jgi:hypothetical protein